MSFAKKLFLPNICLMMIVRFCLLQVQNLYADGHEIASFSISHSFGEQFSKEANLALDSSNLILKILLSSSIAFRARRAHRAVLAGAAYDIFQRRGGGIKILCTRRAETCYPPYLTKNFPHQEFYLSILVIFMSKS